MGYTSTYGATRKISLDIDGIYWVRVREFSVPEQQAMVEETVAKLQQTTGDVLARMQALNTSSLYRDILAERVVAWNLTDEDDQPIPFAAEQVTSYLSPDHQQKVIDALVPERLRFMRLLSDTMVENFDRSYRTLAQQAGEPDREEAADERVTPIRPSVEVAPDPEAPDGVAETREGF